MDVMIDLETLGTSPGSVIISLGACIFSPDVHHEGWPKFYQIISRQNCEAYGLTTDQATMYWWQRQSLEACEVLDKAQDIFAASLPIALRSFNSWIAKNWNDAQAENAPSFSVSPKPNIWGNGSDFDNVLLVAAYKACKMKPAWSYSGHRCFRTLKNLFPHWALPESERGGTHHNALDDAVFQARSAANILCNLQRHIPDGVLIAGT